MEFDLDKYKRELLFRGQQVGNNRWVYGYYLYNSITGKTYILESVSGFSSIQHIEVIPDTVGQYSSYKEFVFSDQTRRRKIFEHDIVEIWAERLLNGDRAVTEYDTYVKIRGVVVFCDGYWKIDCDNKYNDWLRQPKGGEKLSRVLNHWSELDDYGWGVFKNQKRLEWYLEREANHPLNYLNDIIVIGNIHNNSELLD